jgi:hypothetical protein
MVCRAVGKRQVLIRMDGEYGWQDTIFIMRNIRGNANKIVDCAGFPVFCGLLKIFLRLIISELRKKPNP